MSSTALDATSVAVPRDQVVAKSGEQSDLREVSVQAQSLFKPVNQVNVGAAESGRMDPSIFKDNSSAFEQAANPDQARAPRPENRAFDKKDLPPEPLNQNLPRLGQDGPKQPAGDASPGLNVPHPAVDAKALEELKKLGMNPDVPPPTLGAPGGRPSDAPTAPKVEETAGKFGSGNFDQEAQPKPRTLNDEIRDHAEKGLTPEERAQYEKEKEENKKRFPWAEPLPMHKKVNERAAEIREKIESDVRSGMTPEQQKGVDDDIKRHAEETAKWDADFGPNGRLRNASINMPPRPELSERAQEYQRKIRERTMQYMQRDN